MYGLIWLTDISSRVKDHEVLTMLTSALCHDLDHPGYNNAYQVECRVIRGGVGRERVRRKRVRVRVRSCVGRKRGRRCVREGRCGEGEGKEVCEGGKVCGGRGEGGL